MIKTFLFRLLFIDKYQSILLKNYLSKFAIKLLHNTQVARENISH